MCESIGLADDDERPLTDLNSVTVTCHGCGRTNVVFPNDRHKPRKPMTAERYITAIVCKECRRAGAPGKDLALAAQWVSDGIVEARYRMSTLCRSGRSYGRLRRGSAGISAYADR